MRSDRIEKSVLLRASRERVWRAISDAGEFGTWFGVAFDAPFVEGARVTGRIVPTRVDAEVAAMQKPHEGTPFAFVVERIEPMRRMVFRWHPYALDAGVDYSAEPMTRIDLDLADAGSDADAGIRLTISESGFDQLPPTRRAQAYAANEGGWEAQTRLIAKYLASGGDG
jgi:uncharacterized protein YndB with AHSA1/START domain